MSLVSRAATKTLPSFQFMDAETVAWIRANRPAHLVKHYPKEKQIAKKLAQFELLESWFAEPRIINTIHGLRHMLRTAIYSMILAVIHDLSEKDRMNVIVAALLHDLRRLDDKGDIGHAERGATWADAHWQEVLNHFKLSDDQVDKGTVIAAISLHERPYTDIADANYDMYSTCVDILKTADALDRYRLPKLKWWPNPELIRLQPPKGLYSLAYDLVNQSEGLYLRDLDNSESIWETLKEICCAD